MGGGHLRGFILRPVPGGLWYSVGRLFRYPYDAGVLAFSFVWPPRLVVGVVLALLVLCPCISALAYRISSREPVIQRLRETS